VQSQSATLVGTLDSDQYTQWYERGRGIVQSDPENHFKQTFSMGSLRVDAATCRNASGKWSIVQPMRITPTYSNLDGVLKPKGDARVGYGVKVEKGIPMSADYPHGGLQLRGFGCDGGSGKLTLKDALSVPLPIPYVGSLIQFAVGSALPDAEEGAHCFAEAGPLQIAFAIGSDGSIALSEDSDVGYTTWGDVATDGPFDHVIRHDVTVAQP
jgi:hypothetical protein